MTAASIITMFPSATNHDLLLDVVARARYGEPDALVYVFDNVFYDVYHDVFLATRDRRQAEQVTRDALKRLPRLLRSGRYTTLDQISDSLVAQARRRVPALRKPETSADSLEPLRAVVRHVVLLTAASIASMRAVILAI
jgi:hypothetical protein